MLWIISHSSNYTVPISSPCNSYFAARHGRNLHGIESLESAALDNERLKLPQVVAQSINFAIDDDLLADK